MHNTKQNKIYEILLSYSTDDCNGIDSYIIDTYKKAVKKFNEIVQEEKTNIYWIQEAFKNDEALKDYDFDTNIDFDYPKNEEHELYWEITDKYEWYHHDYLELRIKEIE